MAKIHPTAIVDSKAELGNNVEVGPFTILEGNVMIDEGCRLQSHVLIASGTRLGKNIFVGKGAVLGTEPQDLKFKNEKTYLEVGDNTVIREFATLNRGTSYSYKTVVGKNCFLMAYMHIAHDCVIGNNVIISNAVNMAGHVVIEDYAAVGGLTAIHQFVRLGQHSFIGGGLRIPRDVPPYILAMGEPLQYGGTNYVGLSRRGFDEEVILEIKRAYKLIYKSNFTIREAVAKIEETLKPLPEIKNIVEFLKKSERGLIRG
ncbi:MAG: acyl-ACP--UDP-N-acetylglucosamine O-acyltransferase [Aliifodinibius sp.]|nr:acyl-ACP--UDP-N-acetylglucosamine O-acyltransferase [Fodinibius sp.]